MTDQVLAAAVRGWEGEICDLRDLADVTATIAGDTLLAEAPTLTPSQARQLLYCVYALNKQIGRFVDGYYAAIES